MKKAFIAWKASTPAQRELRGEPLTQVAWAEAHDLAVKTVEKWAVDLRDEVEELRARVVTQSGGVVALTAEQPEIESLPRHERFAILIDRQINAALDNDQKAMDWLRSNQTLLKPILDKLNEEMISDLAGFSDEQLAARVVDHLEDLVVAELRRRGWVVGGPSDVAG